jgi:hypothetical protein
MLSELRFALNYRADSFSPLMVILSGQPRLAGCDKQIFTARKRTHFPSFPP